MADRGSLSALGLTDPDRAHRIIVSLAGQGVTDDDVEALLPTLLAALKKSPDPDRALNNFSRWIDSVHSRFTHFQYLLRHPAAVDIFFNVCGVSQLFSDILIRNPEYFEILANPGVRGGAKSAGTLYRELSAFVAPIQRTELKLEAMRRFKQREFLRIGTRDILELDDMPTTAREFSNLADACVQACLETASTELAVRFGPPPPFIVVAMGKHGGSELNYSSDIDLLFVCADESRVESRESTEEPTVSGTLDSRLSTLDHSHRLAELVMQYLTRNLQNGHLFRVDMRLRPEGRFGALVRTLSSYRAYYESWAEPWERQALIKARVVAGESALAEAFQEMVTPYVYRGRVTSDFVESIRRNKERIEQRALLEGSSETNVKVGAGGIRDIEFSVQLLQLQLGGRYPQVRTPNSLEAIASLRQIGALSAQEAAEMSDDYRFLRTVEHRLQILYELQTQSLPTRPEERRLLARRLGFSDAGAFDREYARRTARVRAHCERIFYGTDARRTDGDPHDHWSELLSGAGSDPARAVVVQALDAEGFGDPERAAAILRGLLFGSDYGETTPEARELLLSLSGRLIAAAARTGDPDAVLRGVEALALAAPNPAALYRTLLEAEDLLDRLALLAAGSLPMVQLLARRPEWLDMLVSEEVIDPDLKPVEAYRNDLDERLIRGESEEAYWDALAHYIQRERLRIAARDLWGELGAVGVMRELTALAEAVLESLLVRAIRQVGEAHPQGAGALASLAVIGLGKLGGRELGYGSDWDVTFCYRKPEGDTAGTFAAVEAAVTAMLGAGPNLTARGAPVEIDARLRPEGRVGALAYTAEEYEHYYRSAAQTWEHQVLTRARPVGGDDESSRAFMTMRDRVIYSSALTLEAEGEIRAMKHRMETERLKPEDRHTDVKLGWGGMTDIEFLTQLMQLRHGWAQTRVRVPDTVKALQSLGTVGAIAAPDAGRMAETYRFLNGVRNRLALAGASTPNKLPTDPRRLRAVAIGLGAADSDTEKAEVLFRCRLEERMRETRALFERLFGARGL